MNIIVLLKRVPDLVEDLEIDSSGKSLDPEQLKLTLNEFDDQALEEALQLKENGGGQVTVVAVEGDEVDKMLFTALAKGADRAIKIGGAGPLDGNLALARILKDVVSGQTFDLILTGVQAADDRDGQLAPTLAALLDLPCVEVVTGITPGEGSLVLHKEYSGGILAEYEVTLPAILGIQAARQAPRYAPVSKVRQIQQSATIEAANATADAAAAGLEVLIMTPPETGEGAQMLDGVEELVAVLDSKGVL
jgi:electron transfer flavoprotein beta subunit